MKETKDFYDNSYIQEKCAAQRRWPNEEFCRFMGRNFFCIKQEERKDVKILEVGCGTGANLRVLVDEGFDAYGMDFSRNALDLVKYIVKSDDVCLFEGDMTDFLYKENYFDAIVDVFSSFCLDEKGFSKMVDSLYANLKAGGKFFSYTPSKGSDIFIETKDEDKVDSSTLDGIKRESAPYYGNDYPFRFFGKNEITSYFDSVHWKINFCETVGRTYRNGEEYFEYIVFEVEKI